MPGFAGPGCQTRYAGLPPLLQALAVQPMRMSRLVFATVLVFAISTTFVFIRGIDRGPRFYISNDSAEAVAVTVSRLDKSRNLGAIEPGSRISLTSRDDASMVFTVRYADGREIESQPIYFTSGIVVNVIVTQDGLDVKREIDTEPAHE